MEVATAILVTLAAVFAAYIAACIIASTGASLEHSRRLDSIDRKITVLALAGLTSAILAFINKRSI